MERRKRVAIFGGGIGGLSAAMELAAHPGFEVHLFEGSPSLGGKARSQVEASTGEGGRADLPGEHGFRFFPAFYRNVIDTMARIPTAGGGSVADHLVPAPEMAMAEPWRAPSLLPRGRPRTVAEALATAHRTWRFLHGSGIHPAELARFGARLLSFLCACDERRFGVHEEMSFWELVEGDRYSERFQRYLDASRFMVAMDARRGSARTIAEKALQVMAGYGRRDGQVDRVLDGPTNERWIDPWEAHLRRLGVVFHLGCPLLRLEVHPTANRLSGARVGGREGLVEADHYVLCVPVEHAARCLGAASARDPLLRRLAAAPSMTSWMVGAQFYLRREIPVCAGHVAYPDSPWGLTSISQAQFWRRRGGPPFAARYGDGGVHDILSVDVCEWHRPGRYTTKTAARCSSADEVLREVWRQLKDGLNGGRAPILRDEDLVRCRLDAGVTFGPGGAENATPLLVHPPGSWRDRPEATTAIENLTLAADYVRTTIDLATMEGANEAARLAANAIFAREGVPRRAAVFPAGAEVGSLVALARWIDGRRWRIQERHAPASAAESAPRPHGSAVKIPRLDRWIGLRAPSDGSGFVTPFAEARLAPVGGAFFERWAEAHRATLRAGGADGLVPRLDRLAWEGFDPRRVDPLVRDFYEHTSRFSIVITSVDWNGGWHAAGRLFRAWADRAGNLRPPLDAGAGRREMRSTIDLLAGGRDGAPDYRIWRRVFEKDGELFYVAAVHTFRAARDGEDRAYLALTFPWPGFALAVVLECRNAPGPSDFEMSTRADRASLAGTYAVLPGPGGRSSFARLAGLHEHFRFARRAGPGAPVVEGTHSAYVGSARVFTLHYEIAHERAERSARSGIVGCEPEPPTAP